MRSTKKCRYCTCGKILNAKLLFFLKSSWDLKMSHISNHYLFTIALNVMIHNYSKQKNLWEKFAHNEMKLQVRKTVKKKTFKTLYFLSVFKMDGTEKVIPFCMNCNSFWFSNATCFSWKKLPFSWIFEL